MPVLDPNSFEEERPELVFGFVAPVGTPLVHLCDRLAATLHHHEYEAHTIRLSDFLQEFQLPTLPLHDPASEFSRVTNLMDRGNELRREMGGGEALALRAAAEIHHKRPAKGSRSLPGTAFILRQLKHPDEVIWLRRIYGSAFHLLAVHCPESVRRSHLEQLKGMSSDEAEKLIQRDLGEESRFGQQLAKTFHRSDVFVELGGFDQTNFERAGRELTRYLDLLFGAPGISPTRQEYGMFLAASASLRSADLSRQVGASILSPSGEVVALGTNEVPAAGGGQYWGQEKPDERDFVRGEDANAKVIHDCLEEVLSILDPKLHELSAEDRGTRVQQAEEALRTTRLMNLTEFGRAVHAEMEAILAAGRLGISVRRCFLYSTTFPCHNCAKHIVNAGIERVIYIEPYPKSLAGQLHNDSIDLPANREDPDQEQRVRFEPFVGVAPRIYADLFSALTPDGMKIPRKDARGRALTWNWGLRTRMSPLTHIDREAIAAKALIEWDKRLGKNSEGG